MPVFVLHHPDLPGQPVLVPLPDGQELGESWSLSGWQVDADTDPATIAAPAAPDAPAEPVDTEPASDPLDLEKE